MSEFRQCSRNAGTLDRCLKKTAAHLHYCHGCAHVLRLRLGSLSSYQRGKKCVEADAKGIDRPDIAERLIEQLTNGEPRPKCAGCKQRKGLPIGGRFCCNSCAVKFAVAIAQTKRWDEGTESWSKAALEVVS